MDLAELFKNKMYVEFEVHVGTSDGKEVGAQLLLSQHRLRWSKAACRVLEHSVPLMPSLVLRNLGCMEEHYGNAYK